MSSCASIVEEQRVRDMFGGECCPFFIREIAEVMAPASRATKLAEEIAKPTLRRSTRLKKSPKRYH